MPTFFARRTILDCCTISKTFGYNYINKGGRVYLHTHKSIEYLLNTNGSLRYNNKHNYKTNINKNNYTNIREISTCQQNFAKESTNPEEQKTPDKSNQTENKETSEETQQTQLSPAEEELKKRIAVLLKDVENYKDKYTRTLADRENIRQRLEKQIVDQKLYGIQNFSKDLLDVTDVFRKAVESVPKEKMDSSDPLFSSLYDGLVMTENQLLSVLRRHGLKKVTPEPGIVFDTAEHEAMFEVAPTDGKTPGTIAHVIRSGWRLHERCIRSAQVGVVKK